MEYKEIYNPNHHRAKQNGYVDEHILIAESLIGRLLKKTEVVHHKDENKLNNDLSNLIVFVSNAAHSKFHKGGYLVPTSEKYVFDCEFEKEKCIMCGKTLNNNHTKTKLCSTCVCVKNRKVKNRPSKEVLLKLLENNSFVSVGKKYGVSDNTIRKWLR